MAKLNDALAAVLWDDYHAERSVANRNRLVEHYLPLVHRAAYRYRGLYLPYIDVGDLYAVGAIALLQQVERYDPSRGVRFTTYAIPRIAGAMLDEVREMDWVSRSDRKRQAAGEKVPRVGSLELACLCDVVAGPVVDFGRKIQSEDLYRLLTFGLNLFDRVLVRLYWHEYMNMPEIAAVFGIHKTSVRYHMERIKTFIRTHHAGRVREEFAAAT